MTRLLRSWRLKPARALGLLALQAANSWRPVAGYPALPGETTIPGAGNALKTAKIATIWRAHAGNSYFSVKKVNRTFPFSPMRHRNVRRESFLPFSR